MQHFNFFIFVTICIAKIFAAPSPADTDVLGASIDGDDEENYVGSHEAGAALLEIPPSTERQLIQKDIAFDIMKLFATKDYGPTIAAHKKMVLEFANSPYEKYIEFKNRLLVSGVTASFPEFEGPVAAIIKRLYQSEDVAKLRRENQAFDVQCRVTLHSLMAVMIKDRFWMPYLPTIQAIATGLATLDTFYRSTSRQHPFYHHFRYKMYEDYLQTAGPDNLVFPVSAMIGSTFFVKTRGVPVLILGVVTAPLLADGFLNTPLDFWAHDVQHARRQLQETDYFFDTKFKHKDYMTIRTPSAWPTKDQFFRQVSAYAQWLFAELSKEPHLGIRSLMRMIALEIFHEQALVPIKSEVCRAIGSSTFVYPVERADVRDGEIYSNTVVVDDPSLLSSVVYKLRHGSWDNPNHPDNRIVNVEYRNVKHVVIAAQKLLDIAECEPIGLERLTELASMKENLDTPSEEIAYENLV